MTSAQGSDPILLGVLAIVQAGYITPDRAYISVETDEIVADRHAPGPEGWRLDPARMSIEWAVRSFHKNPDSDPNLCFDRAIDWLFDLARQCGSTFDTLPITLRALQAGLHPTEITDALAHGTMLPLADLDFLAALTGNGHPIVLPPRKKTSPVGLPAPTPPRHHLTNGTGGTTR